MNSTMHRHAFVFSACVMFIYFALSLTGLGTQMIADTDPLWHLAAGDLIRQTHAIPQHDPWSFTAADYRWLNIAWSWDALFSYVHDNLGWHGAFALNAIIISVIITLIYITCFIYSGHLAISLITAVSAATMLSMHLRPLQFTNVMAAIWLLLLGRIIRKNISPLWLALCPLSMLLWVNVHGGFATGGVMLLAFFLQALRNHDKQLATAFFITGIATMAAMLCNPYGIAIIEAVMRPLTTNANSFIREWQPFSASAHNLFANFYLVIFVILMARPSESILAAERALSFLWLIMALTANRNLSVFAIMAAPVIALHLKELQMRYCTHLPQWIRTISDAMLHIYNRRAVAYFGICMCVVVALLLPTAPASRAFGQEKIELANLDPEIDFITRYMPQARLLIHFDLAGTVLYETRGKIPVFFDPRTDTAYPPIIARDYMHFMNADRGWEGLMTHYLLDGIMIPNKGYDKVYDRFSHRKGWKMAFKGSTATIFVTTPK